MWCGRRVLLNTLNNMPKNGPAAVLAAAGLFLCSPALKKNRICAAKKGLRAGRAGEGTHERRRPEKGRRILYSMAAPAAAKG